MLDRFTTKELVFLSLLAAALFAIVLSFGSAIVAVTGIPLSYAIVSGFVLPMTAALAVRLVPKFGSLTLLFTVYSILELPTVLGGSPGFWPKIPINALSALAGDVLLMLSGRRRWAFYPIFFVVVTANTLLFILFMSLLGVPGTEKLVSILPWLLPFYYAISTASIFTGNLVADRLEKKGRARLR